MTETPLLSVRNLSLGVQRKGRATTVIVDDISFDVAEGALFAVIGPNGAGKTTLFNMIAGATTPDDGAIVFAGEPIGGLSADAVCRRGIGRTFQVPTTFEDMSVLHNVMVGAFLRHPHRNDAREHARRIVELTGLAPDRRLLLLDEAMAGLRPKETDRMVATLRDLNRETGVTILLIEHVMRAVMALASRVLVLDHGVAIAEGAPEAVVRDPAVVQSYLGTETV